jgi:hypothetical protein
MMPNETGARAAKQTSKTEEREPTKQELEKQMQQTREALTETIAEIKGTVEQEYAAAKQTVTGVLDYREHFKEEPLVWSLGALSAGFALGYTVGYAHKGAHKKGGKQSPLVAFADSMVDELSSLGQGLVMPALSVKIRELFGFDFTTLLQEMGGAKREVRSGARKLSQKTPTKRRATKKTTKKVARKKSR